MLFAKNKNIKCAILALFLAFFVANTPSFSSNDEAGGVNTVVIDPGHGGHDPGTIWANGKYKEKNIVLSVSLKLGELIKKKYPNVKVLYTRTSDKYVGLSERSDFANRNKADLFISIHVNSTGTSSVTGTETFVMGTHKSESNFELCKAENSVIVFEDDYQSKYEGFDPNSPESYIIFSLLQNVHLEQSLRFADLVQQKYKSGPIYANRGVKQGGLLVLWKSTMPAVLTEIGFLSNSKDRNVLISKEGQNKIANNLFRAFCEYKEEIEKELVSVPKSSSEAQSSEYYTIQILSVGKQLPANAKELKGLAEYDYIKAGNTYKYTTGRYNTKSEAQKELSAVRKLYKGAFVVKVKNGKIEI